MKSKNVTPIEDANLVLEAEGRFTNRPTKTGKKLYDKYSIYVPTELARDSQFPFEPGDEVTIKVEGDSVRIRKVARAKQ